MITTNYDEGFFNHVIDTPITINDWALTKRSHPWRAPECIRLSVEGKRDTDGKHIVTSGIVRHENGCVYTSSGSCYRLGKVHPEYAKKFPQWKEWVK